MYEGKLVRAQLTFGKSLCDIETCRPAQGLEAIHPVGFDGFTQDARQRECGAQLASLRRVRAEHGRHRTPMSTIVGGRLEGAV